MSLDVERQKKRLRVMVGVVGASVLLALAAALGFFVTGQPWLLGAFVAAILIGFGAQLWLIAGLRRPKGQG